MKVVQPKVRFAPVEGSKLTKAQAERYGLEIQRLNEQGVQTPKGIVEAARSPRSPLHDHFTWDKDKAHEKLLVLEARYLLRSIVVIPVIHGSATPMRAFLQVKVGEGAERASVYLPTASVGADTALRQQVIERALREAQQWRERYEQYAELAELSRAILRVERQLNNRSRAAA